MTLWCSGADRFPRTAATQVARGERTGTTRTVEVWRGRHGTPIQTWAVYASDGVACWDLD